MLVPAGLVVLVVALAALQYRWLGQVSEAERDELSRSLEQRARAFTDDFDLELSRAFLAFQLGETPVTMTDTSGVEQRLASWRAVAQFPDLVGAVYLAHAEANLALSRYDAGRSAWQGVEWPVELEPVRQQLTPQVTHTIPSGGPIDRQVISVTMSALVREVPALVVPVANPLRAESEPATPGGRGLERRSSDVLTAFGIGRDFLIVELERDYLTNVMLPAMAERHFGEGEVDRYRVAVVDADGHPLLTRGLSAGASIGETTADVSRRFFDVRLDLARPAGGRRSVFAWQTETARPKAGESDSGQSPPSAGSLSIVVNRAETPAELAALPEKAGWHLLVQHAAGSLDAAVAQARRRNLWLSFGILSVLAASVGLIVINARRSERLAAQQMDFVATVSHELRTPLAVIRSAAQNLSAGVVHDGSQARRYGDLIETEGRRLTGMVEQVLEFAGLSANRRLVRAVPVEPGTLVRDATDAAVESCREQGVEIEVDVSSDLPLIEADEDAVRRALGNLVTNALKYGADGRWIGVAARRAAANPREVLITVSDRGRGIDPDDLAHIFEPFYRGRYALDRQIHGNGLGLSLVQRIAEAHGGRVSVTSAAGEGTTFTLHLPGINGDRSVEPLGEPAAETGRHT